MEEAAYQGIYQAGYHKKGEVDHKVTASIMISKAEDAICDQEETEEQKGKSEQAQKGICSKKKYLVKVERVCCIHDQAVHSPEKQSIEDENVKKKGEYEKIPACGRYIFLYPDISVSNEKRVRNNKYCKGIEEEITHRGYPVGNREGARTEYISVVKIAGHLENKHQQAYQDHINDIRENKQ